MTKRVETSDKPTAGSGETYLKWARESGGFVDPDDEGALGGTWAWRIRGEEESIMPMMMSDRVKMYL